MVSASCGPSMWRFYFTVKPVLWDHCHERPPVLNDHILCRFSCISVQINLSLKATFLRDHIFMDNGVVFEDRFYCTCLVNLFVALFSLYPIFVFSSYLSHSIISGWQLTRRVSWSSCRAFLSSILSSQPSSSYAPRTKSTSSLAYWQSTQCPVTGNCC